MPNSNPNLDTTTTIGSAAPTPTQRRCVNCGIHLDIPAGKRGRPTRYCGLACKTTFRKHIAQLRVAASIERLKGETTQNSKLIDDAKGFEVRADLLANTRTTWEELHA